MQLRIGRQFLQSAATRLTLQDTNAERRPENDSGRRLCFCRPDCTGSVRELETTPTETEQIGFKKL